MITADIFGPDVIIVIVVGVIVLLFGGAKLPKLARGIGSASHEFKKGLEEGASEAKAADLPSGAGGAVSVPPAAPNATQPAQPRDPSNS